jgi:hypothetical protein
MNLNQEMVGITNSEITKCGDPLKVFILNFRRFGFRGCLTSTTSATSEGAQGFFFKNYVFEISAFQGKR